MSMPKTIEFTKKKKKKKTTTNTHLLRTRTRTSVANRIEVTANAATMAMMMILLSDKNYPSFNGATMRAFPVMLGRPARPRWTGSRARRLCDKCAIAQRRVTKGIQGKWTVASQRKYSKSLLRKNKASLSLLRSCGKSEAARMIRNVYDSRAAGKDENDAKMDRVSKKDCHRIAHIANFHDLPFKSPCGTSPCDRKNT